MDTLPVASEYFRNLGNRIALSTKANSMCPFANSITASLTEQIFNILTLLFGQGSYKSLWFHAEILPIEHDPSKVSSAKRAYCLKTSYRQLSQAKIEAWRDDLINNVLKAYTTSAFLSTQLSQRYNITWRKIGQP